MSAPPDWAEEARDLAGCPSADCKGEECLARQARFAAALRSAYARGRADALEQAATVVEDTDVETHPSFGHPDNGWKTLANAARAVRALAEKETTP